MLIQSGCFILDKSVGGCGYVGDHQHAVEFLGDTNPAKPGGTTTAPQAAI